MLRCYLICAEDLAPQMKASDVTSALRSKGWESVGRCRRLPCLLRSHMSAVRRVLSKAINDTMKCNFLWRDEHGTDLSRGGNVELRAPFCAKASSEIRNHLPWIGAVTFTDKGMSVQWLYDTLVARAGYELPCNQKFQWLRCLPTFP